MKRKSFQGVFNIIRFNWHFYFFAGIVLFILLYFKRYLPEVLQPIAFWMSVLAIITINLSLLISFYIYDYSDLYKLSWLVGFDNKKLLNVNAGFDETSEIIKGKFKNIELTICDFYDPNKHTELSIERARNAYPQIADVVKVSTDKLPFDDYSFDYVLAIFAAHEIRNEKERMKFFKELKRVTKPSGQIIVTEHLRDLNNFIAYTIGFLHFYSRGNWLRTFNQAKLIVKKEIKTTPFITTFILEKNGNTL